jgi:sarcosine oxidase
VPSAVVLGAGVFGAALAHRLTAAGWTVTLVEQYAPGHVRAASGGESRVMRFAHGSDRWHARSAWRARTLWRELEEEAATELFFPAGAAWLVRRADGWEAESECSATKASPVERLAPEEASRLFPSIDHEDRAFVLYEPEAGVLRARKAVAALVDLARARGTEVVTGAARPRGAIVEVDGETLHADRVVWACGSWLPRLFPDLIDVRVTKQDVFFFGVPPAWQTPPLAAEHGPPARDESLSAAALDVRGFKISPDREGPRFDCEGDARVASPEAERQAREYLRRRFPDIGDAPLVGTRTCPYALTVDARFVVAPHPEHERVWILGAGSGHGFKHGPAIAEWVTALLEERQPADPRFGLEPRSPRGALRTAPSVRRTP